MKNKNGTVVSTLYLLGGDRAAKYDFGDVMMRLYGDNLTPGSSTDSISVCNAYNYSSEKTSDFIGVTIRSMLYGQPMDYKGNPEVHFGIQLKSVDGNTKVKDITGPISEYELEPRDDDGIIEIGAGRICTDGYVKPGRYTYLVDLYTIEHYSNIEQTYNKHIATKYFDVNVSGIDIGEFKLSKKESGVSPDLLNKAKSNIENNSYDLSEFVNSAYEFSVDTPVTTNIEMDSAKAHIDTKHTDDTDTTGIKVIVFESITFKLSQDINGQKAYVYYTYKFNDYELASFPIAITAEGETNDGSNTSAGE